MYVISQGFERCRNHNANIVVIFVLRTPTIRRNSYSGIVNNPTYQSPVKIGSERKTINTISKFMKF